MGMYTAIGAGGGAALEMIIGGIGDAMAEGNIEKANQIYRDVLENNKDIELPPFEEIVAQVTEKQPGSDPVAREAQMGAMMKLRDLANQGGLDPQALAQLQEARGSMEQAASGQAQAAKSAMARRGMAGSGDELAASLIGAQGASARGSRAGTDIASDARMRALGALKDSSGIASQVRSGDLSDQNAQASRDQFNANMRMAAQTGNIAQKQALHKMKLGKLDRVNDAQKDVAGRWDDSGVRMRRKYSGAGRGANKMSAEGGKFADAYMGSGGMGGGGGGMGGMGGG